MNKKLLEIDYTNYRGERSKRVVLPIKVWFGSTEWHKNPQWLLRAKDIEKDAERDFALIDIHHMQSVS